MLDKDSYVLMKYQQSKFIDVLEPKELQANHQHHYTDHDSQVNNLPSIDDVRDYV